MSRIIGVEGFRKLYNGVITNVNDADRIAFQVSTESGKSIPYGSFLTKTDNRKYYEAVQNLANGTVTSEKDIMGIAVSTLVNLKRTYGDNLGYNNSGIKDGEYAPGVSANMLLKGEVAIKFVGDVPGEHSEVYLITSSTNPEVLGLASTSSTGTGADTTVTLSKYMFTGVVDGNLAIIRKMY